MKAECRIVAALISLLLVSGCASTSNPATATALPTVRPPRPASQLPSLESHLAADWISAATRIRRGNSIIYYRGTTQGSSGGDDAWTGTVQGDILFLSPQYALLIPSGTLTLAHGKRIKVLGPHRMILADPTETPKWRRLLAT